MWHSSLSLPARIERKTKSKTKNNSDLFGCDLWFSLFCLLKHMHDQHQRQHQQFSAASRCHRMTVIWLELWITSIKILFLSDVMDKNVIRSKYKIDYFVEFSCLPLCLLFFCRVWRLLCERMSPSNFVVSIRWIHHWYLRHQHFCYILRLTINSWWLSRFQNVGHVGHSNEMAVGFVKIECMNVHQRGISHEKSSVCAEAGSDCGVKGKNHEPSNLI